MINNDATLKVHQLALGRAENFVYVLADTATSRAVVVDPAWDAAAIAAALRDNDYTLTAIWLTHGHGDHTNAVDEVLDFAPVPIYLNRHMPDKWRPSRGKLVEFDDGDVLAVGDLKFTVIHTPGHSPDGSCFLHRNHLIAGDTLFIDGCGRCDLPDSDVEAMYNSIHNRLMTLADNTIIYPGHDYGTLTYDTLANQKRTNRFMVAADKEAFIRERMG